ncbi:MAG TPA: YceI family protein [Ignavibacteriaceae bacterium]|nr:YceI family protein [Ignavibacteriaceae bacterium]
MKTLIKITIISILFGYSIFPQGTPTGQVGFDVKASGVQTFSFKDAKGRNQTTFTSITALDEVDGTSNDVSGTISFDPKNVAATLKGEISIATASISTGISMRDKDLRAPKWLDAEQFPQISFTIKKVTGVKKLSANKLEVNLIGIFFLHGVKNEIPVSATLTYLDESPVTESREPGDLLGVTAKFQIMLSKFGVKNMILGSRVADKIDIGVNIVGTNKF